MVSETPATSWPYLRNIGTQNIMFATCILLASCATLPSTLFQNHVTERQYDYSYADVWHNVVDFLVDNTNTIATADYHGGLVVTGPQVSNSTYPGTAQCGRDLTALPLGYSATITVMMRDLGERRTNVRVQVLYKASRQSLIDKKVRLYPCNSTGVWERHMLNEIEERL